MLIVELQMTFFLGLCGSVKCATVLKSEPEAREA